VRCVHRVLGKWQGILILSRHDKVRKNGAAGPVAVQIQGAAAAGEARVLALARDSWQ